MPVPRSIGFALAALALVAAVQAPAQDAVDPEAQRARLNAEQAAAARAQVEQNEVNQAAHDSADKARAEAIAAHQAAAAQAQADYQAALAAHQAKVKQWEAEVAACKKRDRKRCPSLRKK